MHLRLAFIMEAFLVQHNHGKARVRVLKVHRETARRHRVCEMTVETTLFSAEYEKVYTEGDNGGLIATDTQKNTVYVVAKTCPMESPEQFAEALARHFIRKYPVLSGIEVTVKQHAWQRVIAADGVEHAHGFTAQGPEYALATVSLERGAAPRMVSAIKSFVFLKTTQSGFENFLRNEHTTLPETNERCLSSVLNAEWQYTAARDSLPNGVDYAATRAEVRRCILEGILGPADTGVYSPSLQRTVYNAGCHVLTNVAAVQSIFIDTPNVHYIPVAPLGTAGFENDIFMPTSDPAGTICCTLSRSSTPSSTIGPSPGGVHMRSKL